MTVELTNPIDLDYFSDGPSVRPSLRSPALLAASYT